MPRKALPSIRLKKAKATHANQLARWMHSTRLRRTMPALASREFRRPATWRAILKSEQADHLFIIYGARKAVGISILYSVDRKKRTAFGGLGIFGSRAHHRGFGLAAKLQQLNYAFNTLKLKTIYSKISKTGSKIENGLNHIGYKDASLAQHKRFKVTRGKHKLLALRRASWIAFQKRRVDL